MSSEVPATPETPTAEPAPAVTAPEPAKPEAQAQPEPDYRAAYVGLQRSQNKLYKTVEATRAENRALIEVVDTLKKGQDALLKQSVGDDEFAKIRAQEEQGKLQAASLQAAQNAERMIVSQTRIFIGLLQEAGVDPNTVDWASDANGPDDWAERVNASVRQAVRAAKEQSLRKHEATIVAKSRREVEAEAEALTQRNLKEAGVDRIDTARGSGSSSSYVEKVKNLKFGTPEYEEWKRGVLSGRTQTK
jgi:hypothetical protein